MFDSGSWCNLAYLLDLSLLSKPAVMLSLGTCAKILTKNSITFDIMSKFRQTWNKIIFYWFV